jgi:putative transcription factor
MPVVPVQSGGQDWAPVNAGAGGLSKPKVPVNAQQLRLAKAAGLVTTEKRVNAGGNKSAHTSGAGMSARKIEEATEVGTLAKVDKDLSKAIMQARMAKKMTQKELATAINEKPQVVGDYEAGKAIPNPAIILKLERSLGVKLPRPGKTKVPTTNTSGASGTASTSANKAAAVTRGGPPKRR